MWDKIITNERKLFDLNFTEIVRYKDLLFMLVKRDFVVVYKQTILGPLWFLVQPILTTVVFTFIFGKVAQLSTDSIPPSLYYLAGIVIWNFFSECFLQTSDTFVQNQEMFGKVYFPRLVVPLSKVISGLLKFAIQFILFLGVLLFFLSKGFPLSIGWSLAFFPLLVLMMACLGLGFGLLFTSLTTKYRDLKFLIQFGVQLLQYVSVIIPLSAISGSYRDIVQINPLMHIIECFRFMFLGQGSFSMNGILYALACSIIVLIFGVLIFNSTERKFIDTV